MGMAVLVSKEIYNIAELCEKETLKALIGTDHEWLYEILMTLDSGNIERFLEVCHRFDIFNRHEIIRKNQKQLDQKIRILAFLDLIFKREKSDSILTFVDVAWITQIEVEDVELLLMKSMSLGLIKGIIDQVDQTLRIIWVKPRMLSKQKIEIMKDKLSKWSKDCNEQLINLENYCGNQL